VWILHLGVMSNLITQILPKNVIICQSLTISLKKVDLIESKPLNTFVYIYTKGRNKKRNTSWKKRDLND
jgi:hypothetical protein